MTARWHRQGKKEEKNELTIDRSEEFNEYVNPEVEESAFYSNIMKKMKNKTSYDIVIYTEEQVNVALYWFGHEENMLMSVTYICSWKGKWKEKCY